MRSHYLFFALVGFFLTFPSFYLTAQVGINADNSPPNPSAMLDVNSASRGFLMPRMTFDQCNAIAAPAEGLMVFCTNCTVNGALSLYSNGAWHSFIPCNTPSATAGVSAISPGRIVWNWTSVPGATGYKWNTTGNYGTAMDMGVATTKTETGISCGTAYSRYVWVNNECGISIPLTLSQAISASAPVTPSSGTQTPAVTTIVWNWNTVSDVTGYKWNTTSDLASATDMGMVTTKTETGLSCNTPYTRYVWAYNGCGNSAVLTLTQSTSGCLFTCGSSITINHVASGGVAPVNKTVTYGTVNSIPGEPAKCWITRNLGASQQATAVSDATEASAGWYFQFNRQQGYQYTTSRTPVSAWNTIGDNWSDSWEAAKDPCTIELGTGWRIPTNTEWTNVDGSTGGNWTNWTGPYGSALILHAAGALTSYDGSLFNRGSSGYYWSNMQYDATYGIYLRFYSSSSDLNHDYKAAGFSIRCVRD